MPWNLLIFPLVAGYFVLTTSYFFKYRQQRIENQRLIFESILIGVLVTTITYGIRKYFEFYHPGVFATFCQFVPIKEKYAGTSLATIIIALLFTYVGNRFIDQKKFIKRAIKLFGNEYEILLSEAINHNKLLLFTLKSGKFYIGWVKELPIPNKSDYVRIIPAISGYRDECHRLVFTTHYLKVYAEYIRLGRTSDVYLLGTDIVVLSSDVVSVSNFDLALYDQLNDET